MAPRSTPNAHNKVRLLGRTTGWKVPFHPNAHKRSQNTNSATPLTMKALTITPQTSSDSDNTCPLAIDRFASKGFMELTEIGECLSLELSTPDDTSDVFRTGRLSLVEEMLFVLKRANPISDHRDDSDESVSPAAKRKRRSYDDLNEPTNEREGVDEATLTSESSQSQEYEGGEDEDEYDFEEFDSEVENRGTIMPNWFPVDEPCAAD
jgi:hypothetical protein